MVPARPPYFSWATPYITLKEIDAALDFYEKAFGFVLKEKIAGEDKITFHAEMFYKDQLLMFGKEGAYDSPLLAPLSTQQKCPINMYLYCENVDAFFENAVKHGAKIIAAPEDVFWGDRLCRLHCPENYLWVFATFLGGNCLGNK